MYGDVIYDYLIVGAGIIGINISIALKKKYPRAKILIIEKEKELARHGSGRNSGVLHAGFYYTSDSLKAKFTRDGNRAMRDFCQQRGLRINHCGKVVVATNAKELEGLEELKRRGDANGVELEWMSQEELEVKYPNVKTYKKALFSPTTATVDPVEVTREFAKYAMELGVEIDMDTAYREHTQPYKIVTNKSVIEYNKLINCAGLYADKIAQDYGFAKDYVIIPFKGIYLKDAQNLSSLDTNIYPVPNLANPFLGVHYTLTVDGAAKIGPTAIPALWRENYKALSGMMPNEMMQILYYELKLFITNAFGFRKLAIEEIKKYSKAHLMMLAKKLTSKMSHDGYTSWSKPGIRAQLLDTKSLELVQDFVVQSDDRTIHILNAVSPAFTSSIPFAQWVVDEHIASSK